MMSHTTFGRYESRPYPCGQPVSSSQQLLSDEPYANSIMINFDGVNSMRTMEPFTDDERTNPFDLVARPILPRPTLQLREPAGAGECSDNSAGRRRWQLSDSDWEDNKAMIHRLYMIKGNTLKQTMEIMEEKYNFRASTKLYKERFKRWRFVKNFKKTQVREAVRQAHNRDGRQTEILVGGVSLGMDRMKRACDRLPAEEAVKLDSQNNTSDVDIIVRNPSSMISVTTPTAGLGHANLISVDQASLNLPFTVVARTPLDTESLRADGRKLSLDHLLRFKKDGIIALTENRFDRAIISFKAALSGLRNLHDSIHPDVVETSWYLANALWRSGTPPLADEVINWISRNYSEELGLWHPQTISHYTRVVEILRASARNDDARMLGINFYIAVRDGVDPCKMIEITRGEIPDTSMICISDIAEFQQTFAICDDERKVSQQLLLARLWTAARLPGMESILRQLVEHSESSVATMRARAVEARCILIDLYIGEDDHEAATTECKLARDMLAKLILELRISMLQPLLVLSRELAQLHLLNGDENGYKNVLAWTADNFQNKLPTSSWPQGGSEHIQQFIDHLIQVGIDWQNRYGRNAARPWFERSYALSLKNLGALHDKSRQLEGLLNPHASMRVHHP